jgi:hypothetical protein
MTPHILTPNELPIYQGAKWSHTLTITQAGTTTPVDLTGLGPFVMEIRRVTGNGLLVSPTCTVATPANGQIAVLLTAAQTEVLPLGSVRVGLRDAQNNPYIEGETEVRRFTPNPATL